MILNIVSLHRACYGEKGETYKKISAIAERLHV